MKSQTCLVFITFLQPSSAILFTKFSRAYAFYNVSFTVPLKDLLLDSLILEKKVCCWYWYNSSDSNLANIGTMLPRMKQGSISTAVE